MPDNAFNSVEAAERVRERTVQNVSAFLAGRPVNVVGKIIMAESGSSTDVPPLTPCKHR